MLRKNAMAKSISENNSRDLWKEVYKVRSKCKTSSQCMDDVSGNESISELFAHKYNVLYNSVCSNTTQLNKLLALNENYIITNCSNNNTSLINKHMFQCMDDVSGNESISELFAHKYNVLYNSVCSNTTQFNELLALNENYIITNCSNNNTSLINKHTHHVSVDQLQNAIRL